MMKIGVIGSGPVGLTLAHGFLNEGHEVMLGTSQPDKPKTVEWKQKNPTAKINSFHATAAFADIIVLAVKGAAALEALEKAGRENLIDKIVIDSTNPIDTNIPPKDGVLSYFTSPDQSLMETLQLEHPDAKFVKAFNTVGNPIMYKPDFKEGRPTMLIAGNDKEAKTTVHSILESFGWGGRGYGFFNSSTSSGNDGYDLVCTRLSK